MKLLVTAGIVLLSISMAYSQEIDSRLLKRYSNDDLKSMQAEAPDEVAMLTYALDNALYITDAPSGKTDQLGSIAKFDKMSDFISMGLTIKDENQYLLIEGTDKMLVVKSTWVLNNERNK